MTRLRWADLDIADMDNRGVRDVACDRGEGRRSFIIRNLVVTSSIGDLYTCQSLCYTSATTKERDLPDDHWRSHFLRWTVRHLTTWQSERHVDVINNRERTATYGTTYKGAADKSLLEGSLLGLLSRSLRLRLVAVAITVELIIRWVGRGITVGVLRVRRCIGRRILVAAGGRLLVMLAGWSAVSITWLVMASYRVVQDCLFLGLGSLNGY